MKSSELLRLLRKAGWYPESQKGSHIKLIHSDRNDFIIFPNHGSKEMGKGFREENTETSWTINLIVSFKENKNSSKANLRLLQGL